MIRYAVTADLVRSQVEQADVVKAAKVEADYAILRAAGVLRDTFDVRDLGPLTVTRRLLRCAFRWDPADPSAAAELVECDDDRWEIARYTFSRTGR